MIVRPHHRRRSLGRRWLAADDGTAAVEFALVAPLLLLLAFGIVVISIYLAAWIGVIQASAEGARASVAGLGATERQTLAASRVQAVMAGYSPLLDPTKVVTEYPVTPTGYFSVKVTYPVLSLGLSRYSALAPAPTTSPTRTATVTTGGY